MENRKIFEIVDAVTAYAVSHDFAGYSKYDGLSSPILSTLSLNNSWLRLLFIQAVMRFPVNIRPLLRIKTSRNPKGIALFARGYLLLYAATNNGYYKALAEEALDWLTTHHSNQNNNFSGYCWGYNFIWQSPFFHAPKYSPNITVTVFAGEAFMLGYKLLNTQKYLGVARSAADYILQDLPVLHETATEKCLGYVSASVSEQVINVNSMAAALLAKLYAATQEEIYRENAIKLVNFVVRNAMENNRWAYTTDVEHSYIDNYHTGGIIDELLEVMEELDYWEWKSTLTNAVRYYKESLFTQKGAPKNRNTREYPYDIHGAAQGIITFSKIDRFEADSSAFAEKIFEWTLKHLYSGRGYFYYQKTRFYTKKFTFMRWCNAWMIYAMGEFSKCLSEQN